MTSTQLMNAILSMDSYNRGYDEVIIVSGQMQLGSATVSIDSGELGNTNFGGV